MKSPVVWDPPLSFTTLVFPESVPFVVWKSKPWLVVVSMYQRIVNFSFPSSYLCYDNQFTNLMSFIHQKLFDVKNSDRCCLPATFWFKTFSEVGLGLLFTSFKSGAIHNYQHVLLWTKLSKCEVKWGQNARKNVDFGHKNGEGEGNKVTTILFIRKNIDSSFIKW